MFVHGSLSETYGNVMGEALWCGTPTVAFSDGMGVSSQIKDRVNGVLLAPGKGRRGEKDADAAFGRAVLDLLKNPQERSRLGTAASKLARERCSPVAIQTRIADAFRHAQDHAAACHINPAADGRARCSRGWRPCNTSALWAAINSTLYLTGHLRPAEDHARAVGGGLMYAACCRRCRKASAMRVWTATGEQRSRASFRRRHARTARALHLRIAERPEHRATEGGVALLLVRHGPCPGRGRTPFTRSLICEETPMPIREGDRRRAARRALRPSTLPYVSLSEPWTNTSAYA